MSIATFLHSQIRDTIAIDHLPKWDREDYPGYWVMNMEELLSAYECYYILCELELERGIDQNNIDEYKTTFIEFIEQQLAQEDKQP